MISWLVRDKSVKLERISSMFDTQRLIPYKAGANIVMFDCSNLTFDATALIAPILMFDVYVSNVLYFEPKVTDFREGGIRPVRRGRGRQRLSRSTGDVTKRAGAAADDKVGLEVKYCTSIVYESLIVRTTTGRIGDALEGLDDVELRPLADAPAQVPSKHGLAVMQLPRTAAVARAGRQSWKREHHQARRQGRRKNLPRFYQGYGRNIG